MSVRRRRRRRSAAAAAARLSRSLHSPALSRAADPAFRGLPPSEARATISWDQMPPFVGEATLGFAPARPVFSFRSRAAGIAETSIGLRLLDLRPPLFLNLLPCLIFPPNSQQVKRVRCESSGVLVPKDKAVKRFIVRNIVDASAVRDLQVSGEKERERVEARESKRTKEVRRLPESLRAKKKKSTQTTGLVGHRRLHAPEDLPQGLLLHLGRNPLQGRACTLEGEPQDPRFQAP